MENKEIQLYHERAEGVSRQKQYRTMGLITFCVAAGVTLFRLLSYYLPITDDTVSDLVFTLLVQVGVLFVMPVLVYKFVLKKSVKQILDFSGFHKTKWYNCVLAVPLGLCCFILTIGVSGIWQGIISALGYTHASNPLPEKFSAGLMILSFVLTGILPGFCEEFFNRGGLLTVIKGSFPFYTAVAIMGLEFGLFHQNITQVFYTALFGAFMAFLCIKLKSVYPAMIIHFVNNSSSVFFDYADTYGFFKGTWFEGGFFTLVNEVAATRPYLLVIGFVLTAAIAIGIVMLMLYLNSSRKLRKKKDIIADSGFDHTNNRVVLVGEQNPHQVREMGLDKEVYGEAVKEDLYKPTLADNAFFIGAIVLTVLTTVFSFIFGAIR